MSSTGAITGRTATPTSASAASERSRFGTSTRYATTTPRQRVRRASALGQQVERRVQPGQAEGEAARGHGQPRPRREPDAEPGHDHEERRGGVRVAERLGEPRADRNCARVAAWMICTTVTTPSAATTAAEREDRRPERPARRPPRRRAPRRRASRAAPRSTRPRRRRGPRPTTIVAKLQTVNAAEARDRRERDARQAGELPARRHGRASRPRPSTIRPIGYQTVGANAPSRSTMNATSAKTTASGSALHGESALRRPAAGSGAMPALRTGGSIARSDAVGVPARARSYRRHRTATLGRVPGRRPRLALCRDARRGRRRADLRPRPAAPRRTRSSTSAWPSHGDGPLRTAAAELGSAVRPARATCAARCRRFTTRSACSS